MYKDSSIFMTVLVYRRTTGCDVVAKMVQRQEVARIESDSAKVFSSIILFWRRDYEFPKED